MRFEPPDRSMLPPALIAGYTADEPSSAEPLSSILSDDDARDVFEASGLRPFRGALGL